MSYNKPLPKITREQVIQEVRKAKKTKSRVEGDIFVNVLSDCIEILAETIATIYNEIVTNGIWPAAWLTEHVTIIPKNKNPETPAECRNISCTNFLSKVLERLVLGWAREQSNQKQISMGGRRAVPQTISLWTYGTR